MGVPAAGRGEPELEELIGYFSTTLVLRAELADGPAFGELLRRVRRSALAAFTHDRVPFERLIDELGVERRLGGSPLFQTLLTVHTQDEGAGAERSFAGLRCAEADGGHAASKFELTLDIRREGADLITVFGYRTALLDADRVDALAGNFETLLRGALDAPDTPLPELPLLTGREREELRALGTGPEAPAADAVALPRVLAGVAAGEHGASVAVRGPDATLTHRALWDAAGALAVRLHRAGVRRGDVVGVCLPRGAAAVTAMLGAWRAGAAYLPLDLAYPAPRLEFMVRDAGIRVVVGPAAGPAPRLPRGVAVLGEEAGSGPGTPDPGWEAGPDDAAYLIHTSGSTGTPKGVVVPHRALAALGRRDAPGLRDHARRPDPPVRLAQLRHPRGGDLPRAHRGSPPRRRGERRHPAGPARRRARAGGHGAGPAHPVLAPAGRHHRHRGLAARTAAADPRRRPGLRRGGRRLAGALRGAGPRRQLLRPDRDHGDRQRGGPGPGRRDAPAPIGRPLDGTTLAVCDARGRPLPRGAAGELLIGGVGVTYGYRGRPGATARAFVPDPWGPPGALRYRTGDLVRWRSDGQLEFLGRIDAQIKVRGYRVEPGEVEAALLGLPGVGRAVVVVRDEALVGYVVAAAEHRGEALVPASLRAALAGTLPAHLVPNSVVVLDGLPLTPNGKLDRRALPAPDRRPELGDGYVAPRSDAESLVADVWAEVLGLDRVGVLDDFFDLGGHSLLATRVVARIRATAGLTVPLRVLFAHRTAQAFAVAVEDLLLAEIEALSEADAEELLAAPAAPDRNGTTA